MKCPFCQNEITECKICPFCKSNLVFWKKIIDLSDVFYNRALKETQKNNLYTAKKNLEQSLLLSRKNINAQNLLGLIYFKTGKIADALKYWIISNSIEKNDLAEKYILAAQENPKILDMYNEAIKFYNLGLEYIKQNNDDMGVINLKKSLELNPNFVDALNLLALCYLYQEKKSEAQKLLDRVLFIDKSNLLANKYYKNFIADEIHEPKQNKSLIKKNYAQIFNFPAIIIFLLGMIFSGVMIYVLIFPTQINNKNKIIKNLEKELDVIQENYNSLNEKLPAIKKENDDLLKKNIELEKKILLEENKKLLAEAEDLYKKNKFAEAGDLILNINFEQEENLPDGALELKNKIYSRTAKYYYETALKFYRQKNYEEAKNNLNKALAFDDGTFKDKINLYLDKINSVAE